MISRCDHSPRLHLCVHKLMVQICVCVRESTALALRMVPLQQQRSVSGLACKVAQAGLGLAIDFSLSSILPWHEPPVDKVGVNSLTVHFTYFSYLVQLKWPSTTFPNKNEAKHFSATEFHVRG